jgi:molybdate transport system regulatory protein
MNRLHGHVIGIESHDQVLLVDVQCRGIVFSATLLDTPEGADYLYLGAEVVLMFKETEVSLAKDLSGRISLRNRFPVTIRAIEQGNVLSMVHLDCQGQKLTSVVTTRAVKYLELTPGDTLEALVKANEIMLGPWP